MILFWIASGERPNFNAISAVVASFSTSSASSRSSASVHGVPLLGCMAAVSVYGERPTDLGLAAEAPPINPSGVADTSCALMSARRSPPISPITPGGELLRFDTVMPSERRLGR